ncbi:MAG TPA: cell division protein ZapA [Bacteroidia bacterium]|nr:cell division protein ZapA [Bacteroidia bacterium]
MSELNIKVEISGSIYPLKVDSEDEKSIKEAVELINNKIAEFEKKYAIRDKKDVLGMVMLQLVSQLYKQSQDKEQELKHFKQLFAEVDDMLRLHRDEVKSINEG